MEESRIREIFIQAEKDWSRWSILGYRYNVTTKGFCKYFKDRFKLTNTEVDEYLRPYWEPFRTRPGLFHFNNKRERKDVLKKINKQFK